MIIPAGSVSEERPTIVNIPHREVTCKPMNRSLQVIAETLDEQDANESCAVNTKLCEMQHARRDFVMTVGSLASGGSFNDDSNSSMSFYSSPPISPIAHIPGAELPSPGPCIYNIPDISDPRYGRNHPDVEAAREYLRNVKMAERQRVTDMMFDDDYLQVGNQQVDDYDPEYLEGGPIFGPDDDLLGSPCPMATAIPRRLTYTYPSFDSDEFERFLNAPDYPSQSAPSGPPPGREQLNADLWEVDDPWYYECVPQDGPDLIDFSR